MRVVKPIYHLIFAVIFILEMLSIQLNLHMLEYLAKPSILIWIIFVFLVHTETRNVLKRLILLAFLFSLLGDVLLMIASTKESFFIPGVAAFLVAHLFFIFAFSKVENKGQAFLKKKPILVLPVAAFGFTLYILLFPHLDFVLRIAIFIYACVITGMVLMAINRKGNVTPPSFSWVVFGALLFFISDGLLSTNKFWLELPNAGIWIMGTYMLAQYFILIGMLQQKKQV